jgi:hypothetical protein
MFHRHDVVVLKKPLPGIDVPLGTTGTIIRLFDWTDPPSYHIHFDHPSQKGWSLLVRGDDALELKRSIWQELKEKRGFK